MISKVVAIDESGQLDARQRLRGTFKEIGRQSVLHSNLHGIDTLPVVWLIFF